MPIRINKVTKECNVGLQTLVDFLHKKGYTEVEANPNATISDEQYELVQAEFSKGPQIKGIKIPVQQPAPVRKPKERKETIVVPDVEQFPGHIACSSLSRSEIVVPVFSKTDEVVAVLDIDSKELATFDETDRLYLETICRLIK